MSGIEQAGMFLESMEPTFWSKGDAMPAQELVGIRPKYIHQVGTVGKVEFVHNGTKYTGMFDTAQYGYIRLSVAANPSTSFLTPQPLAPGMGLKWLRDGMDSANLVSMYSVNGQPGNWNFFGNDFSNHIGFATSLKVKALV